MLPHGVWFHSLTSFIHSLSLVICEDKILHCTLLHLGLFLLDFFQSFQLPKMGCVVATGENPSTAPAEGSRFTHHTAGTLEPTHHESLPAAADVSGDARRGNFPRVTLMQTIAPHAMSPTEQLVVPSAQVESPSKDVGGPKDVHKSPNDAPSSLSLGFPILPLMEGNGNTTNNGNSVIHTPTIVEPSGLFGFGSQLSFPNEGPPSFPITSSTRAVRDEFNPFGRFLCSPNNFHASALSSMTSETDYIIGESMEPLSP